MAAWHTQRLEALGARLDWSRCFVSVLFVDAQAPSYARARLAQRISDGAAAWNGLSRTLEFYACAHVAEETTEALGPVGCVAEFAENVGIEEEELRQIFRKLGSGVRVSLGDEALREHDLIIALDEEAADAVNRELVKQGLPAGTALLLSDFEWCLLADDAARVAVCPDGSLQPFIAPEALEALDRHAFEFGRKRAWKIGMGAKTQRRLQLWGRSNWLASEQLDARPVAGSECRRDDTDLDLPPWPRRPMGLGSEDSLPAEWRSLHCALLRGAWGVVWFLFRSWKDSQRDE